MLSRHARARSRTHGWCEHPTLTGVVLSALVEDPELFRQPLPPLSELLPLPEDLRPQDSWGDVGSETGNTLRVTVPERVAGELGRRADLLGERLPDYLSMLLSAAADRLLPPAPYARPSRYTYFDTDDWDEAPEPGTRYGEVVDLRESPR